MKYIIVEDEKFSAERLKNMIGRLAPTLVHVASLDSVKAVVEWLQRNTQPALAFFDIQLADGISFEIFEKIKIEFPVIFTTAYNEYALKAFKVNSIDYLLKPIDETELQQAIHKFLNKPSMATPFDSAQLIQIIEQQSKKYKNRFLVKIGDHLKMVNSADIAWFYSMSKYTFIKTLDNHNYDIDQTLDQLELLINAAEFFRINRGCIISAQAIKDISVHSNSRLKINPVIKPDEEIIVSRERVSDFKKWMER